MTSAPKRIRISLIPTAKFLGGDVGTASGSIGCLQEKLQCGHAAGISRRSSGETVSRDLHLWHSNEIARISSNPTTIFRSNVTLPKCTTPPRARAEDSIRKGPAFVAAAFRRATCLPAFR